MLLKKVRELCEKKGISIYRLEKDLGFPGASICKWGNSVPGVDKLKKVADYFDVSIEYFFDNHNS